jgi:hypothetical protein
MSWQPVDEIFKMEPLQRGDCAECPMHCKEEVCLVYVDDEYVNQLCGDCAAHLCTKYQLEKDCTLPKGYVIQVHRCINETDDQDDKDDEGEVILQKDEYYDFRSFEDAKKFFASWPDTAFGEGARPIMVRVIPEEDQMTRQNDDDGENCDSIEDLFDIVHDSIAMFIGSRRYCGGPAWRVHQYHQKMDHIMTLVKSVDKLTNASYECKLLNTLDDAIGRNFRCVTYIILQFSGSVLGFAGQSVEFMPDSKHPIKRVYSIIKRYRDATHVNDKDTMSTKKQKILDTRF